MQGGVECLDGVMLVFAHGSESFFHRMLNKPDSSGVHVGHDHGTLDLDQLGSVVKVNSNQTRNTFEEEVELQKDSFNNPSLVFAASLDRAGEIDAINIKREPFRQSREGRFGNLLVKTRTASDIDIIFVRRCLKDNIRPGCVSKEGSGLLIFVKSVLKEVDDIRTRVMASDKVGRGILKWTRRMIIEEIMGMA